MSLMTLDQAIREREGKKLVFTNGVFDVLHVGHVRYLCQARQLGELLFIGLNSDDSVKRLGKGDDRPINDFQDRAEVLSALRCVDGIICFDELTPERLVSALRPEVYVKGGDYTLEALPEAPIVHSYGGEVVLVPLVEGKSTTIILKKLGLS